MKTFILIKIIMYLFLLVSNTILIESSNLKLKSFKQAKKLNNDLYGYNSCCKSEYIIYSKKCKIVVGIITNKLKNIEDKSSTCIKIGHNLFDIFYIINFKTKQDKNEEMIIEDKKQHEVTIENYTKEKPKKILMDIFTMFVNIIESSDHIKSSDKKNEVNKSIETIETIESTENIELIDTNGHIEIQNKHNVYLLNNMKSNIFYYLIMIRRKLTIANFLKSLIKLLSIYKCGLDYLKLIFKDDKEFFENNFIKKYDYLNLYNLIRLQE